MSQTTIYNKSKKLKQFLSNTTDREYNMTNMFEIRLNEIKTFKNRTFMFGPNGSDRTSHISEIKYVKKWILVTEGADACHS